MIKKISAVLLAVLMLCTVFSACTDEKGNEADAVVEFPDGTWGAFEIKLGANQVDAAAEELLELKRIMESEGDNPPKILCVICGMTNMAYKREDGVYVVPITALGP